MFADIFSALHLRRIFGDRLKYRQHVGFLEAELPDRAITLQATGGDLTSDHESRDGIKVGAACSSEQIGRPWAARGDSDAHFSGRSRISVCGHGGALLVL